MDGQARRMSRPGNGYPVEPVEDDARTESRVVKAVWASLFGIWFVFLSGLFAGTVGSPGVLQLVRLSRLLESKRLVQEDLESRVQLLDAESARLERSRYAQEKEIRKVLGYAAPDELVFDFPGAPNTP